MDDLAYRGKIFSSKTGLKRDLSQLSNLIKSITGQNDFEFKGQKNKLHKSIKPHKYSFILQKTIGKLSSSETLEKKKSSNKKRKSIRNKFKSERIVTNYKVINVEKEDYIEESKAELKRKICKNYEINPLSFALNLHKKNPKIDVVENNNYNFKNEVSPENYLLIPYKLKKEINLLSLNIIYPIDNKYGKCTKYIQKVSKSIKDFINLDYDSIFSIENSNNVKYLIYENRINNNINKKLLLLDLDETLIHSEFRDASNYKYLDKMKENSKCYNRSFSYINKNYKYYFEIYFRPFLFDFLHEIKNYFDLAIFTASLKGYADTVINYIDPNNEYFKFRLYREACIPIQKYIFIKDLRIIKNYDPKNVILLDNSFYSFINQPLNGMLIYSFFSNYKDNQLIHAKNFLIKYIYPSNDVRIEIEKWFQYNELMGKKFSKENDSDDN